MSSSINQFSQDLTQVVQKNTISESAKKKETEERHDNTA